MKHVLLYMTAIVMLLSACSAGSNKEIADQQPASAEEKPADNITDTSATTFSPQLIKTQPDWNKKIIKTANITLELPDYVGYSNALHSGLKAYGAYIASEEQTQTEYRVSNTVTIKVPVDQFDNFVNSFSGKDFKVLQKKISSEDVTANVYDTRSRIEAKKQVRDRYLDLLKQAKNMKEILDVQREISSIQEELESFSGQLNYLSHESAYSTVHLEYFQLLTPEPEQKPESFAFRIKEGFNAGVTVIGSLIVFAITIWPLLLAATVFVIWWRKKKPLRYKV